MAKNIQHIPEQDLLNFFYEEKDEKYLGELLSRYTLRLLGVGLKYLKDEDDAKDMVQQVFEKALKEVGKYPIANFGGWLYRIAQNYCISSLRVRKDFQNFDQIEQIKDDENFDLTVILEKDKQHQRLEQALGLIKDEQRTCIELFYLKKHTYLEIAAICSLEVKMVKSHIQNGKRNLRLIIEQLEQGDYVKK
ncbi:MAG TPA: RNA polymerase sigma factor [Edaphocola sp.]|nr:RNA polymerase sigma factor [Edaphocola sp.]